MRHVDFNPALHPRDKEGQFARGSGDLKSHLEAKIAADKKRKLLEGYTFGEHPATEIGHHNYTAHDPQGNLAGFINVSPDKAGGHYVSGLMVYPEHQRRGLGTALWEHAGRPLHDPDEQSEAGRAWAQAVGGEDKRTGRNTVAGILVGGKVIDSSELPRHEPSAAQQASQAEARKYVNMDLKWPTRQDLPRAMDRDAKQGFITAQFHGILGRKGLDTDKLHPTTLDDIMAHTGLPEERRGEVADVLTELEARGVVFAKGGHLEDERAYWINKAVGSARSGGGRGRPGPDVVTKASSSAGPVPGDPAPKKLTADDAFDDGPSGALARKYPQRAAPPGATWLHTSLTPLKPGTVITPGGAGNTPKDLPKDLLPRRKWTWMARNTAWIRGAHTYEVEPSEGPYPWNGDGLEGWVAPSARVIRRVDSKQQKSL